MTQFWLATFKTRKPARATRSVAVPIAASGSCDLAIEVIREPSSQRNRPDAFAVLVSAVNAREPGDSGRPTRLSCLIGFVNDPANAIVWRDRGFPIIDAAIHRRDDGLVVSCACFAEQHEMDYSTDLLTLKGVDFRTGDSTLDDLRYIQTEDLPDFTFPATTVFRTHVDWVPPHRDVAQLTPDAAGFGPVNNLVRSPSLEPLTQTPPPAFTHIWSGEIDLERVERKRGNAPAVHASRADTFGVPAFRFEDVEVLGFRIDLGELSNDPDTHLETLISELNFHLHDSTAPKRGLAVADFRYRPATRTVLLELLRYGKMRLSSPIEPLGIEDFQSQHELLLRVLVGRVDDDSAQARAPAVFVPAIFVDNPWSKVIGRVQGFDKRMTGFCLDAGPHGSPRVLLPNGCQVSCNTPERLVTVRAINLTNQIGSPAGERLIEFDLPEEDLDDDAFEEIDLDLSLGSSPLLGARWRQEDFDRTEFRRSFAQSAIARNLRGFRSIQVAPFSPKPLVKTWITGAFVIDTPVLFSHPAGVATLRLCEPPPHAPVGWRGFRGALADPDEPLCFPTGSWYRMKLSMTLNLENPLD